MLSPDLAGHWDALIQDSPDAWFFHTFAEQTLLEEAWPIQTLSYMLSWGGMMIAACPLQRFKWTPALLHSTNMGPGGFALSGALSAEERQFFKPVIYQVLKQVCGRMGVAQVEISVPPLAQSSIASWNEENDLLKYGFEDRSTVTTVIDLKQTEMQILQRFSSTHRYGLKKTQMLDIEVFMATSKDALDEYYKLHVETYQRTGVTPHPKAYFEAIFRHFIAENKAYCFMARFQGRLIGAMNLAVFGASSLYWTGAYSQEGLDLRVARLLQWRAMQFSKSIGLKYHETGEIFPNAQPGTKEAGLTEFKRRFGGQVVPFRKGLLRV